MKKLFTKQPKPKTDQGQTPKQNIPLQMPGQSAPSSQTAQNASGPISFDVDTASFEQQVIKASQKTPILVDFWAPWCGPCKQLMPTLEAAVQATGGKIKLAKVNIDENPELAQALQVQSVPTVFAFFQGQPVTAFTGNKAPSEIKNLIQQLIGMARQSQPDALNIPETLVAAAQALASKDFNQALQIYQAILSQDETNIDAYVGLVRTFIAAGALDDAQTLIDQAPPEILTHNNFAAARTALELAQASPAGETASLQQSVEKNPDDHQGRYDLAQSLFTQGDHEDAVEQLIEIIRRDREWNDEAARKQLLKYFDAMGPSDPVSQKGRRALSSVLFS